MSPEGLCLGWFHDGVSPRGLVQLTTWAFYTLNTHSFVNCCPFVAIHIPRTDAVDSRMLRLLRPVIPVDFDLTGDRFTILGRPSISFSSFANTASEIAKTQQRLAAAGGVVSISAVPSERSLTK